MPGSTRKSNPKDPRPTPYARPPASGPSSSVSVGPPEPAGALPRLGAGAGSSATPASESSAPAASATGPGPTRRQSTRLMNLPGPYNRPQAPGPSTSQSGTSGSQNVLTSEAAGTSSPSPAGGSAGYQNTAGSSSSQDAKIGKPGTGEFGPSGHSMLSGPSELNVDPRKNPVDPRAAPTVTTHLGDPGNVPREVPDGGISNSTTKPDGTPLNQDHNQRMTEKTMLGQERMGQQAGPTQGSGGGIQGGWGGDKPGANTELSVGTTAANTLGNAAIGASGRTGTGFIPAVQMAAGENQQSKIYGQIPDQPQKPDAPPGEGSTKRVPPDASVNPVADKLTGEVKGLGQPGSDKISAPTEQPTALSNPSAALPGIASAGLSGDPTTKAPVALPALPPPAPPPSSGKSGDAEQTTPPAQQPSSQSPQPPPQSPPSQPPPSQPPPPGDGGSAGQNPASSGKEAVDDADDKGDHLEDSDNDHEAMQDEHLNELDDENEAHEENTEQEYHEDHYDDSGIEHHHSSFLDHDELQHHDYADNFHAHHEHGQHEQYDDGDDEDNHYDGEDDDGHYSHQDHVHGGQDHESKHYDHHEAHGHLDFDGEESEHERYSAYDHGHYDDHADYGDDAEEAEDQDDNDDDDHEEEHVEEDEDQEFIHHEHYSFEHELAAENGY